MNPPQQSGAGRGILWGGWHTAHQKRNADDADLLAPDEGADCENCAVEGWHWSWPWWKRSEPQMVGWTFPVEPPVGIDARDDSADDGYVGEHPITIPETAVMP